MEIRAIFILLGLAVAAGAFAEAYTWTDDQGIVHYSGWPNLGVKAIEIGDGNTQRPRSAPQAIAALPDGEDTAAPASIGYQNLKVASPGAEETLWNIEGSLNGTLTLTQSLRSGHQVRVYFEGAPQIVSNATL